MMPPICTQLAPTSAELLLHSLSCRRRQARRCCRTTGVLQTPRPIWASELLPALTQSPQQVDGREAIQAPYFSGFLRVNLMLAGNSKVKTGSFSKSVLKPSNEKALVPEEVLLPWGLGNVVFSPTRDPFSGLA